MCKQNHGSPGRRPVVFSEVIWQLRELQLKAEMGASLSAKPSSSPSTALKSEPLQQFLYKERATGFVDAKPRFLNGTPLRKESEDGKHTKPWMPFSQAIGGSSVQPEAEYLDQLQLVGVHNIGPKTFLKTLLQGTRVQLEEFQLTLLHTLADSRQSEETKAWKNGQITICAGTDFHLRHRLTLESILGSEDKGLTFATVISTDFASGIAWGVANSYRPRDKLTLFSRFTSDDYSGKRLILQAVQKLNDSNTLSPVYATTLGNPPQAGISWIHQFNGSTEDTFQVKAFCNKEGSFSVNVKAQVGEVQ